MNNTYLKNIILNLTGIILFLFAYPDSLFSQKDSTKDQVHVIHADLLKFERVNQKEIQYLSHDVLIQHKKVYLLCDSAIIEGNRVKAIGHVRIVEGDSLQIFGDTLNYFGDLSRADFVGNVVLNHREKQLFTTKLSYDLKKRIASYHQTAVLTTGTTHLKSNHGYYFAKTEESFFKDSVIVLMDDGMNLLSDSLIYRSKQNKVFFTGPTTIKNTNLEIYTEQGYYDIVSKQSVFENYPRYNQGSQYADAQIIYNDNVNAITILKGNAFIRDSIKEAKGDSIYINDKTNWVNIIGHAEYKEGNRILKGEKINYNRKSGSLDVEGETTVTEGSRTIQSKTLQYDQKTDFGKAIGSVKVVDTSSGYTVHCDTLEYSKITNRFHALGHRPYISTPFDKDTLYLAADSLYSEQKIEIVDSLHADTLKILRAFRNVKIWSPRIQGLCDSLIYNSKDSLFTLYYNPVLWSDTSQFTGDTIRMFMAAKSIKEIHLNPNGFVISESNGSLYSQIKGRYILASFQSKKIHDVDVQGNAESIYFIQDDSKAYIGTNRIICSKINILFNAAEKIDRIFFYTKPEGKILPIHEGRNVFLEGFKLRNSEKPKSLEEILK